MNLGKYKKTGKGGKDRRGVGYRYRILNTITQIEKRGNQSKGERERPLKQGIIMKLKQHIP